MELSTNLDYVDKCNSAPLETYLRLFADIFLADEEYAYFMLALYNTGRIETKGGPTAYHVSDYITSILKQKHIEKVNKGQDPAIQSKGTEDPAVKAFCNMIEMHFIERNTSSDNPGYQANASYLFNLNRFLITSFYSLDKYINRIENELKDPIAMRHVKYYCKYCDAKYTEADLCKLNRGGNLETRICLLCSKPQLTQVTKENRIKDDTIMKKGMLSILKELHGLGTKIMSEYMDKKASYYVVRLRELQNAYQNNFIEGQLMYNKCNNVTNVKDIDEDEESLEMEENFTWLSTGGANLKVSAPETKKEAAGDDGFASSLSTRGHGGRRRRRTDVTCTDSKSVFSKRNGGFWRSEKLGGMTILGEPTRKPKWFLNINEKARRILRCELVYRSSNLECEVWSGQFGV